MRLQALKKPALSDEFRLLDDKGEVSHRAVARLLRAALSRWGLSPKRAVLRYARDQLRAAEVQDLAQVPRVLDHLLALGECASVYLGSEAYIAPCPPRWIAVDEMTGVYLGTPELPTDIPQLPGGGHPDIVQRIDVSSDDVPAQLQADGVTEVSFRNWLLPLAYLEHASRRRGSPARSDVVTLGDFWELLTASMAEDALHLSEDAEVRAVVGSPGEYFGRGDRATPDGRWTNSPPDGVWCAVRRGYNDAHWHPILIDLKGPDRRTLDLFDHDEWRWALLARGLHWGQEEHLATKDDTTQSTVPLPRQLQAALDILGPSTGPWTWQLTTSAGRLWELVR